MRRVMFPGVLTLRHNCQCSSVVVEHLNLVLPKTFARQLSQAQPYVLFVKPGSKRIPLNMSLCTPDMDVQRWQLYAPFKPPW